MKIKKDELNTMVELMGIDDREVELRKEFLGISSEDIDHLRNFNAEIGGASTDFVEKFYKHLLSFEQMRSLLPNEGIIERLRESQAEYFSELTAGCYDRPYINKRLKIGYIHQQVGLEPKWYMGAYNKYLSGLLHEIENKYAADNKKIIEIINSLLKIIFLDMGLAIDSYFYADQKKLRRLKEYSEQIVSQMPNPLAVLDQQLNILSTNREFNRLLNNEEIPEESSHLEDYLPTESIQSSLDNLVAGAQPTYIYINKKTDDGTYHFRVSLSKARIEDDQVYILILEDITEHERLHEDVQASVLRINSILNNIADAVITINDQGIIESFNSSAASIFGYEKHEVIGLNVKILMPEPYSEKHDKFIKKYINTGINHIINVGPREVIGKHKDGHMLDLELSISEMQDSDGHKFIGALRDISLRKENDKQMRTMSRVIEQTAEAVMITDTNGIICYVNPAFEKMTGHKSDEAMGLTPNILKSGSQGIGFYRKLWDKLEDGHEFSDIFINKKKNGNLYYEEKMITPIKDDTGNITHYVSTGTDITDRIQAEEHFHYVAHHDALTDLPNRLLLNERLDHAFTRAVQFDNNVALILIDIDRFKIINDTLGHDVGDMMLKEIAWRIKQCVDIGDTVARFSGDEFSVLFDNVENSNDIVPAVQKMLEDISKPYLIKDRELYVTASIGIAMYPIDGNDSQSIFKHAEVAMYRAKESGNNYQFYSTELSALAFKRLNIEASLRSAIVNNEFKLLYQPQINLKTGQLAGVEALIRWIHPELGMISPDQFIPILEETGLIKEVGEWVLTTSCKQCKEWNHISSTPIRVSVNVSSKQLVDPHLFVERVKSIISSNGIPHDLIEIEITESSLMIDQDNVVDMLKQFRELGISVAIDDFGTGYSSLSYLNKLPIDTLKIDKSFVMDICTNKDSKAITSAIISMAHNLGLKVTAEGVEEIEQLNFLETKSCDFIQGYYISKPVTVEEINVMLNKTDMLNRVV